MLLRRFRIDWSGPLTSGWSFWYDNAGSFYIELDTTARP